MPCRETYNDIKWLRYPKSYNYQKEEPKLISNRRTCILIFIYQISIHAFSTLGISDYLCKNFCSWGSRRRNWACVAPSPLVLSVVRVFMWFST